MIILGSGSPRRRELLEQIGASFRVAVSSAPELKGDDLAPAELTQRNALAKAEAVAAQPEQAGAWVLGADTVVALDGHIYGKPVDAAEAMRMLAELSGRTHEVTTGLAFVRYQPGMAVSESSTASVTTEVTMRELSEAEIREYVQTGEPLDKAGAYGIQGRAAVFITSIAGSYSNVVGLPLARTAELAREVGAELWER